MPRANRYIVPGFCYLWTAYHELMGLRQRYRLIDLERVLEAVAARDLGEFRAHYSRYLDERLKSGLVRREPEWSESIAVGSREFVETMRGRVTHRRSLESASVDSDADLWALREVPASYRPDSSTKRGF